MPSQQKKKTAPAKQNDPVVIEVVKTYSHGSKSPASDAKKRSEPVIQSKMKFKEDEKFTKSDKLIEQEDVANGQTKFLHKSEEKGEVPTEKPKKKKLVEGSVDPKKPTGQFMFFY